MYYTYKVLKSDSMDGYGWRLSLKTSIVLSH